MTWSTDTGSASTFYGSTIYIEYDSIYYRYAPPTPSKPVYLNVFEVLELPTTGASKEQVKRAYRRLAKRHHPDTGGDVEKMALINRAYDFLKERGLA